MSKISAQPLAADTDFTEEVPFRKGGANGRFSLATLKRKMLLGTGERVGAAYGINSALSNGAADLMRNNARRGITIAADKTGASTSLTGLAGLDPDTVSRYDGSTVEIEAHLPATANFLVDKPISGLAGTAFYLDGSSANIGTLVEPGTIDANNVITRRAQLVIVKNMRAIGLPLLIGAGAVAGTAHSIEFASLSLRCVAVPAGAAYNAADVTAALNGALHHRPTIGPLDTIDWSAAPGANGTAIVDALGRSVGIITPAGKATNGALVQGVLNIDPSWGALLQGCHVEIRVPIATTAVFSRSVGPNLNTGSTAFALRAAELLKVSSSAFAAQYVHRYRAIMAGTETSLTIFLKDVATANAAALESWQIDVDNVSIAVVLAPAGIDVPALNERIAQIRRSLNPNLLPSSTGNAMLNDAYLNGEALGGASFTVDARGIRDGLSTPAGSTGASAYVVRTWSFAPVTDAWAGRSVDFKIVMAATANYLTLKGLDITNRLAVKKGGVASNNNGTILRTWQVGNRIYRIIRLPWTADITDAGPCVQTIAAATDTSAASFRIIDWSASPVTPLADSSDTFHGQRAADRRLLVGDIIGLPPADGQTYGIKNGAWALPPSGPGGSGVSRMAIVIAIMGQSTECGAVKDAERAAFAQAFWSQRVAGRAVPFGPNVGTGGRGGWAPKLIDDLWDYGYDAQLLNGAIGSQSFIFHACGALRPRADSAAYYQKRYPTNGRDAGYFGDVMLDATSGRVFQCVAGNDIAAWHDGGPHGWIDGRTPNLDYIDQAPLLDPVNGIYRKTAAARPAALSTVNLNGTVADGDITWKYIGDVTSGIYSGLGAYSVFTETQKGGGFDPFGTLQRLATALSLTSGQRRIVYIANGQADAGNGRSMYGAALKSIGNFYLARGFEIAIGLTQYTATASTAYYDDLALGRSDALAALKADATFGTKVHDGANLYAAMGSTGPMGGAYITASIASNLLTIGTTTKGAVEVGHRIVDPATGNVLGTVASAAGSNQWNLIGGVDTPAGTSLRSVGEFYQTTPADLLIHINGAGMVGPDLEGVSCAGKYVSDAFKAFLPQIAV